MVQSYSNPFQDMSPFLGLAQIKKASAGNDDFAEIEKLQNIDNWSEIAKILSDAAKRLENAGADFILICANTMHKVAPVIEKSINIPLLHIADATAEEIKKKQLSTVGLIGTKFTMEQDFYKGRLKDIHNINVIVPEPSDRDIIHHVIYNELCLGKITTDSRDKFIRIINTLNKQGAEAIVLGCTEIPLLIQQEHTHVLLFNTVEIHANSAVEKALS